MVGQDAVSVPRVTVTLCVPATRVSDAVEAVWPEIVVPLSLHEYVDPVPFTAPSPTDKGAVPVNDPLMSWHCRLDARFTVHVPVLPALVTVTVFVPEVPHFVVNVVPVPVAGVSPPDHANVPSPPDAVITTSEFVVGFAVTREHVGAVVGAATVTTA